MGENFNNYEKKNNYKIWVYKFKDLKLNLN